MTKIRIGAYAFYVAAFIFFGITITAAESGTTNSGSGIGGTGINGAESGGIGGTGISDRPGGGIGGTGISNDEGGGIGGTGITGYGAIQAFGSIFVNGREYAIKPDTMIRVDGVPATHASLQLGEIVLVHGVAGETARSGSAASIDIHHALVGRIETVNANGSQLTILGQRVFAAPDIRIGDEKGRALPLTDVKTGDLVAVSALQRADGVWMAQRFDRVAGAGAAPSVQRFVLEGTVSAWDQSQARLQIAGATMNIGPASAPSPIEPGTLVRVEGVYTPQGLKAESIRPTALDLGQKGTRVEMQGFYSPASTGASAITANGVTALIEGGAVGHIPVATDKAVVVIGTVAQPGVIRINGIEYPNTVEPEQKRGENGKGNENQNSGEGDQGTESTQGAEQPEAIQPEAEHPEVEQPEVESPDVSSPEISTPDVATPDVSTPEISTPDISTPEIETPEVAPPEIETPEPSP